MDFATNNFAPGDMIAATVGAAMNKTAKDVGAKDARDLMTNYNVNDARTLKGVTVTAPPKGVARKQTNNPKWLMPVLLGVSVVLIAAIILSLTKAR